MKKVGILVIMFILFFVLIKEPVRAEEKAIFMNAEQALRLNDACRKYRNEIARSRERRQAGDRLGSNIFYEWFQKDSCKELTPAFEWYINRLTNEVKFIEINDPETLESIYKEWDSNKDLLAVRKLTEIADILKNDPKPINGVSEWNTFISEIINSCQELIIKDDIGSLRAAYWKMNFIKRNNDKAVSIENRIDVKIKEIENEDKKKQEMAAQIENEERRKQELATAARRNLPPNQTPKTRKSTSYGGSWWHNKYGFGDLKWGTDIKTIKGGSTLERIDGLGQYTRDSDNLDYYFFNGKFFAVGMKCNIPHANDTMFNKLVDDYGRPKRTGPGLGYMVVEWKVGNVSVRFISGEYYFQVFWVYLPIASKVDAFNK